MAVLLIYPNRPRLTFGFMPGPYGLEILRARLEPRGIACEIVNPYLFDDPRAELESRLSPDVTLVGLSVRNIDDALILSDLSAEDGRTQTVSAMDEVTETLQWCREIAPNVPIVLGGAAVMHMPAVWRAEYEDMGPIHVEDEQGFLSRAAEMHGVAPLFGPETATPETVPVRREEIYFRFRTDAPLRTYKGCPLQCAHCIEHVGSRVVHRRDVGDVAEEAAFLARTYPQLRRIFFADSEVNLVGEARTRALVTAIRKRPETEPLVMTGYFNPRPMSATLLQFLIENGVHLSLTVDHVADAVLERNGKNFRKRDLERLVDHYSDLGVPLSFCLLLGQPGETRETVDEVLRFVDGIPDSIRGMIYASPGVRVYPETPLAAGLIDGSLDRRWLQGEAGLGNSLAPAAVYCESWEPMALLRYVTTQSDGRISAMNPYLTDMDMSDPAERQRTFENFHVGWAEADRGNTEIAWARWRPLSDEPEFLRGEQRRDFLWERGLVALQQDAPDNALADWSVLRDDLHDNNASGAGLARLDYNIALASHLAAEKAAV